METIKLEFPDRIVECNILGGFPIADRDYIALLPIDGEEDVFFYGYKEVGGKLDLRNLSQEEFDAVIQEFQRILEESEK